MNKIAPKIKETSSHLPDIAQAVAELRRRAVKQMALYRQLVQGGMEPLTALVIAGDMESAERIEQALAAGTIDVYRAVWLVGSYSRWDFAIKHLTARDFAEMAPDLWTGSDPDDTKPDYVRLWKALRIYKGGLITDEYKLLPYDSHGMVYVYRGQKSDSPFGCSWSLSVAVAHRFAKGASFRQRIQGGRVYRATIHESRVYAYLTGRGEAEVILDPADLGDPQPL